MKIDLENDIKETRARLASAKSDEAKLRTDAEQLVAKRKGEGADVLGDPAVFDEIDAAFKLADEKAQECVNLNASIGKALGWVAERAVDGKEGKLETHEARNMIERLCASPIYQEMVEKVKLAGFDGANMGAVQLASREETLAGLLRLNTTVDNSTPGGGGLIWSDRKDIVVPLPQRRVRLLDVITVGTTDSDTVEFVRETLETNNAAETPYGTALPESAYAWNKDVTTVKRVGHWVPATEGALMDAGQLDTILRGKLSNGVLRRTESQIYSGGNGIGENFLSIMDASRAGVQVLDFATAGLSRHDIFHRAMTLIRLSNLDGDNDANAFVINPSDFEEIVLETDDNGNYLHGGGATEPTSIWGVTPVVTNLASSGTTLFGDFTQAVLWVRSGVVISTTNSHADFFPKGLVAMKAEYRAAFDVLQEAAFVKITNL